MGADTLKGNSDDECCDRTGPGLAVGVSGIPNWMFPKIVGFSPQIIYFNRVFHYFHHPFWGTSIFGEHPKWWYFWGVIIVRCQGSNSPNVRGWWRGVQSPPKRKVFFRSIRRLDAGREASEQWQKLVVIGYIYGIMLQTIQLYGGCSKLHKDPFTVDVRTRFGHRPPRRTCALYTCSAGFAPNKARGDSSRKSVPPTIWKKIGCSPFRWW